MRPRVTIAIPALDEEQVIRQSALTLRAFADRELGAYDVTIVIVDNGSTDGTERIGRELAATAPGIAYLRVAERGKGYAIARAWAAHLADISAFMDADLSTDLAALPELLRRVRDGAGLAVGSRFHADSTVRRSWLRRTLSAGYRRLVSVALGVKTADLPCGFKAVSAEVLRTVLPHVRNRTWFFDSELVVRAERFGFVVTEVPVSWHEKRHDGRASKVRIHRLVAEYIREILRLRRELGPVKGDSGDRVERRLAIAAAIALMALTSIVPLYATHVARESGVVWNGRTSFAPGDLAVYLSSIAQAAHGDFLIMNLAGAEGSVGVPHPIWYLGGLLVRWGGLSSLGAYHALRLALIPLLVATVYAALRHFLSDRRSRIAALLLLLFGSGVGMYASYFLAPAVPQSGTYEWPVDLWVAEANVFASSAYSAHFLASWTLLVLSLFLLSRAYDRRSARDAALAGLAALGLASFHPFYALTLAAVAIGWLALWFRRRGLNLSDLVITVIFGSVQVPALAYYAWLSLYTPNGIFMHGTNQLWTPSWPHVLIGIAGFLLLAPIGYVLARENGTESARRAEDLAFWAVVSLLLIYAPVAFERRLLEGLQFPLAALASITVGAGFGRLIVARERLAPYKETLAVVLLVAVFLPSTFGIVYRDVANSFARDTSSFFQKDEAAMLEWLRVETVRDAVVLAGIETGNDILGWGERPVYAGHWAQTTELSRKAADISRFYGNMSSAERRAFMATHGIVYAVEGPRERALGGTVAGDPAFRAVVARGAYAIYIPLP